MKDHLLNIPIETNNNTQALENVYANCQQQIRNGGSVMLDCSNILQIDAEHAKRLFGRLLIDDKSGPIACKNLKYELFKNIADGIQLRFVEKYPHGIRTRWGISRITKPQVEMVNGSTWSTIQLGDDIMQLLRKGTIQ